MVISYTHAQLAACSTILLLATCSYGHYIIGIASNVCSYGHYIISIASNVCSYGHYIISIASNVCSYGHALHHRYSQ